MSKTLQCEICGNRADGRCQNCRQLVCGACCEPVDWGEGEIMACDPCRGVFDDYARMDFDEYSEPDPGTLVYIPVEDVSLACSRCGRLDSFQILYDERDALKEYQERLPYVCYICSPTGNEEWFEGFNELVGVDTEG